MYLDAWPYHFNLISIDIKDGDNLESWKNYFRSIYQCSDQPAPLTCKFNEEQLSMAEYAIQQGDLIKPRNRAHTTFAIEGSLAFTSFAWLQDIVKGIYKPDFEEAKSLAQNLVDWLNCIIPGIITYPRCQIYSPIQRNIIQKNFCSIVINHTCKHSLLRQKLRVNPLSPLRQRVLNKIVFRSSKY